MPMAMRAFILMCCWGPGAHALTLPSYRSAQGDYLNGKASDAQAGLLPNLSTREMTMNAKVPSCLNFSVLMSQRAEHLGDKYTFSHLCISINRRGALQNSSDLDVGRRPELKTDEFCEAPLLLIEI